MPKEGGVSARGGEGQCPRREGQCPRWGGEYLRRGGQCLGAVSVSEVG